jgi:hypothetical protein
MLVCLPHASGMDMHSASKENHTEKRLIMTRTRRWTAEGLSEQVATHSSKEQESMRLAEFIRLLTRPDTAHTCEFPPKGSTCSEQCISAFPANGTARKIDYLMHIKRVQTRPSGSGVPFMTAFGTEQSPGNSRI